jgi:hypothetical protein
MQTTDAKSITEGIRYNHAEKAGVLIDQLEQIKTQQNQVRGQIAQFADAATRL